MVTFIGTWVTAIYSNVVAAIAISSGRPASRAASRVMSQIMHLCGFCSWLLLAPLAIPIIDAAVRLCTVYLLYYCVFRHGVLC